MPRRKTNSPHMKYHNNNDNDNNSTISKKLSKSNEAKRLLKPHLRRKKRELKEEDGYHHNEILRSSNNTASNITTNRNQFQILLGIILTICIPLVYYYHNTHNDNSISLSQIFFNPPESSTTKKKRKRTKYEVEILERKKQQNNEENNNNYYNGDNSNNDNNNDKSLIGVKFEAKNEHGESIPNTEPPQLPIQNADEEGEEEEEEEENIIKPAIAAEEDKITNALKIAYVVPILECSIIYQQQGGSTTNNNINNEISLLHDALTILKHSIHRLSIHNSRSKYNYEMIAFLHQDNNNKNCPLHDKYISLLQSIGYKIMIVGTPVNLKAVRGVYLKGNIAHTRHGAHQDWAKLNIYTLLDYPLVVLIDIRTLFLQPLDELFDIMLNYNNATGTINVNSLWDGEVIPIGYNHIHKHKTHKSVIPSLDIHALYTKSYIDIKPVNNNWKAGINLSMLIIKPNTKVFDNLLNIIREGDYRFFVGWGGKGYANFEGSMQSRGLLTYYYDYLYPSNNLELDRCIYHNTADIPYVKHKSNMICRENINITYDNCMDCRKLSLSNIKVFHYGACSDPWKCFMHTDTLGKLKLCRKMHHYWYRLRNEVENSWERSGKYKKEERKGNFLEYQFLGYCDKDGGYENYIPMKPFA